MSISIRLYILAFLVIVTSISCAQPAGPKYVDQLGDIPFQSKTDDSDFHLCDEENIIHSRLSLTYEGGWKNLNKECKDKFNYQSVFQSFTGYVMIRFLINCNYESDRYRVETMALNFSAKAAPEKLTQHLLSIVQSLDKWQRTERYSTEVDCSKFLNFKIVDGRIEDIIH